MHPRCIAPPPALCALPQMSALLPVPLEFSAHSQGLGEQGRLTEDGTEERVHPQQTANSRAGPWRQLAPSSISILTLSILP